MQKRKIKINILDIAILLAIICSVAALIWRDTISEAFGKPEIVTLETTVVTEKLGEEDTAIFKNGESVIITIDSEGKTEINAKIASVKTDKSGKVTMVLTFDGYRSLGRYYNEQNQKITVKSACVAKIGALECKSTLENVKVSE